jgi:hypothetical protein
MTSGQHDQVEKLWTEAGGNSKLFQKELLDSPVLPRLFADVVKQINRGWLEENGVIYFSVTSDGTTGAEWTSKLEKKTGKLVSVYAKSVLNSPDFKPTKGVTYNIAVLKGELFANHALNIRTEAKRRGFETPNAEISCLIRMKFTDEEIETMGLKWIVTMHEPIIDFSGNPNILGMIWNDYYCISACGGGYVWPRVRGFAFVIPQP